jgi:hypothetical protein
MIKQAIDLQDAQDLTIRRNTIGQLACYRCYAHRQVPPARCLMRGSGVSQFIARTLGRTTTLTIRQSAAYKVVRNMAVRS